MFVVDYALVFLVVFIRSLVVCSSVSVIAFFAGFSFVFYFHFSCVHPVSLCVVVALIHAVVSVAVCMMNMRMMQLYNI